MNNAPKCTLPLLLLAGLLAACAPAAPAGEEALASSVVQASDTVEEEATSLPKVTGTPGPPEKDAPSPTLQDADCLAKGGDVVVYNLPSEYLDGLRARVYTPPCYEEQAQRHFPVIYLIHGQTYTDEQWDRVGADEAADALIGSGEVSPFIIVMPFDGESLRPTVGFLDEALILELVPWVDATFRTIPERDSRAIGGLSRGASWAIHFALVNHDLFGALGGHSPPVFIEEADKVRDWLAAMPEDELPRIWLDIGDRDRPEILSSAEWFAGVLDELNVPHEWHLFTGLHNEEYWSSHVEDYLRWYAREW
jgi:enterochelin esterase-like enzyme